MSSSKGVFVLRIDTVVRLEDVQTKQARVILLRCWECEESTGKERDI